MGSQDPAAVVAARLRADLQAGVLLPRERLVEHELVERYGSSRAVIREALIELATDGIVERKPNRGARVRGLSVRDGLEYAQVRRELEALCAREAARSTDAVGRQRLQALLDGLRAAAEAEDLVEYRVLSAGFHGVVIGLSGHASARRQLEAVRAHDLQRNFPRAFAIGPLTHSEGDHEAIAQAILAGDADRAERSMFVHLDRVVQMLEAYRASIDAND